MRSFLLATLLFAVAGCATTPELSLWRDGADALSYTFKVDEQPLLGGASIVKNLQMNKVSAIVREIGVKPVLSFGNSHTDASMANYVIGVNAYRAAAFMVLCDDETRENGSPEKAAEMKRSCGKSGWIPISMRDDWTTIYGDGVKRK